MFGEEFWEITFPEVYYNGFQKITVYFRLNLLKKPLFIIFIPHDKVNDILRILQKYFKNLK